MQANKYKNQNVAVFGLGKTGLSVINALIKNEAEAYAWDDNAEQIENVKMAYQGCNFIHPREYDWKKINALILSPGIPVSYPQQHWIVKLARAFNCKIKSDIELFLEARTEKQKIVGITGTNGKSTTTSLIGHILSTVGKNVAVGGNLGTPVLDLDENAEIYVIELSSFQLEQVDAINIDISVLLNITADHIDRHGSMENYIAAKLKLINGSKTAVIWCDNEVTARIFNNFSGNKVPISGKAFIEECLRGTEVKKMESMDPSVKHWDDKRLEGMPLSDAKINLISNAENIAAAYAVCKTLGINSSNIISGIESFSGLKHRNELLGKIKNMLFVNDSKATNAESSEKAILSYENIYWIVGGRSKEGGIESLSRYFTRIKKAYLIGESSKVFADTLEDKVNFIQCGNLKNAFEFAYKDALSAKEEVTILLSPACSSFDQWKNFEERGEAFCNMFEKLKDSFTIKHTA
ncbi:MAG: UDP-N-acetylmuramoylalanine--D-glutamate ligase [Wolbachia endosymbiont of Ctenocephalides orientis wCori]|nr:MAG: UDP-N-acetylmuramoylalanine--D-glutamate ligase [Wolbachia endosymbiont of Ctenocephalides orientis wCori]